MLGFQVCAPMPSLSCRSWASNPGPHACAASNLLTEPSISPALFFSFSAYVSMHFYILEIIVFFFKSIMNIFSGQEILLNNFNKYTTLICLIEFCYNLDTLWEPQTEDCGLAICSSKFAWLFLAGVSSDSQLVWCEPSGTN